MKFKITAFTGILLLLISSLSIANPISQTEIPPQKTEQTSKKKLNFIQKIILKKIERKIKKDKEQASASAIVSVIFGSLAFLATPLYLIYPWFLVLIYGGIFILLAGLIATITGDGVIRNSKSNKKTRKLGKAGMVLGLIGAGVTAIFFVVAAFLLFRYLFFFFAS